MRADFAAHPRPVANANCLVNPDYQPDLRPNTGAHDDPRTNDGESEVNISPHSPHRPSTPSTVPQHPVPTTHLPCVIPF